MTSDESDTKTKKLLTPVDGQIQVGDLIIKVDEDAYLDSHWFEQKSWDNLISSKHYFRKLQWLLNTKIIFTEEIRDETKFTQEEVKSCGLFITKDSMPFQLKVRLTTDTHTYESQSIISGRVYLTELHTKDSSRRITIEWGFPDQDNNPNNMMMNKSLRGHLKRCHCKIDE